MINKTKNMNIRWNKTTAFRLKKISDEMPLFMLSKIEFTSPC